MTSRRQAATPAEGWWRFTGPYPVVLVARGLPVAPGDVVHCPDGPPASAHWEPAPAPENAGDGATAEES